MITAPVALSARRRGTRPQTGPDSPWPLYHSSFDTENTEHLNDFYVAALLASEVTEIKGRMHPDKKRRDVCAICDCEIQG